MTRITAMDLTPFYRNTLGMDRVFEKIIQQIDSASTQNYPPYNILKTGDETVEVQVAVAGFSSGEIDVKVQEDTLVITGEKYATDATGTHHEYIHQGISSRRFIRAFPMAENVEVLAAVVKDGILTVKLERIVPESKKPKSIAITYES
jgi:molecular chaperone IbpA